ncbi:MAG: GNAT family N-acetyltransferase [bacterium]
MNNIFIIESKQLSSLSLVTAQKEDIENLRIWKNKNREFFFYKNIITKEAQKIWFKEYLNRPDDYMFIVKVDGTSVGCMGFRLLQNKTLDIYNVILGDKSYEKKGYMSIALKTMCNYAFDTYKLPVTVKVLKENPAVKWYQKKGFIIKQTFEDYFLMEIESKHFKSFDFLIKGV